ncbi:MAG: ABC transporter permease subunit, partial [Ilumatobacteraceae bacterium]
MARYLQLAIAGLTSGSIYALVGLGFNVVFAANGILNLAHGEFFMYGSMLAALFLVSFGWPLAPALLATLVIVGALGAVEERFAVRPMRGRRGAFGWILSTLGFAIVMR